MKRQALQSKIDNISVQLYTTGKELEDNTNEIYKYTSEMLKNISFQLDSLIEFLSAKHTELDSLEQ